MLNDTDVANHQIQRLHTLLEMMDGDPEAVAGSEKYRAMLNQLSEHYGAHPAVVAYALADMACGDLDVMREIEHGDDS